MLSNQIYLDEEVNSKEMVPPIKNNTKRRKIRHINIEIPEKDYYFLKSLTENDQDREVENHIEKLVIEEVDKLRKRLKKKISL